MFSHNNNSIHIVKTLNAAFVVTIVFSW